MRPNPVTFLAATCITLTPALFACDQGEGEDNVASEPRKTIELAVSPLPIVGPDGALVGTQNPI